MKEKIIDDEVLNYANIDYNRINYDVIYRKIKHPRLEFKAGKLIAVLPYGFDVNILLNKYKNWIYSKGSFIKECRKEATFRKLSDRNLEELKTITAEILKNLIEKSGRNIDKVSFRWMKTKWAGLHIRRNSPLKASLSVNKKVKYLPDYLVEYILFHEITHLQEKKHNRKFWEIIKSKYDNYKEMERELFIYWLKISDFCNSVR